MYQINPNLMQTPIENGSVLLLEPNKGLYFELNEVSVEIYLCLSDNMNFTEVVSHILSTFNVEPTQVKKDVQELIKLLIENNIITDLSDLVEE